MKARQLRSPFAFLAALALVIALPARADDDDGVVGKVSVLQGSAERRHASGTAKLGVGTPVHVGDTIVVGEK